MNTPRPDTSTGFDRIAVFLSGLCLFHCLAIPFAIILGPLLSDWLTDSETHVHWGLLAVAVPISGIALWRGYDRHHSQLILFLGGGGLALMLLAVSHALGEALETALTVSGVTALLIAHMRNIRKARHAHG